VYQIGIWADEKQRAALLAELQIKGRVHHRKCSGATSAASADGGSVGGTDHPQRNPCLLLTARDVSLLKNAQAQIRHLAYHDPLTNLPNRAC
jgi:hypothetical protein